MIFKFNLYQRAFSIILLCPLIVFFHVNVTFAQTVVSNKGDITGLPLPRFVSVKSNTPPVNGKLVTAFLGANPPLSS